MDNLPIADRDLLLKPLESALDDLREVILQDESYFASSYDFEKDGIEAEVRFKLDGGDTVMVSSACTGNGIREYHEQFNDEQGKAFYALHRFEYLPAGVDAKASLREYKFYFEDNGAELSVYARMAFGENKAGEWTPVCLTAEEEQFIRGRLNHIRHMKNS